VSSARKLYVKICQHRRHLHVNWSGSGPRPDLWGASQLVVAGEERALLKRTICDLCEKEIAIGGKHHWIPKF